MNRLKQKGLCLLLVLALLFATVPPAVAAVSQEELGAAVEGSAAYMFGAVQTPQVGPIGGEWAVIGLARSGYLVPQQYWEDYYAAVEQYVLQCGGVLHEKKYTEYSRVVLALTAIGADPENVAGFNLLTPLGDFEKTVWQTVNGPVWALIALDSGGYEMPINSAAEIQATRDMYVEEILSHQMEDGGWSLSDSRTGSDPDMTAMALQALSNYLDMDGVKDAVEKGITCLSNMQNEDGGYSSWGTKNLESTAQVVVAVCELGIDLNDRRFVKNGNTLLDSLMSFRCTDGSFIHAEGDDIGTQMSSEQGLYSMAAALRAMEGRSGLYQMDDVEISTPDGSAWGLEGRHEDVNITQVIFPKATFKDVAGSESRTAVEVLASRGIINGMGDGTFVPDSSMTRAQFASIVVKALGLPEVSKSDFLDVSEGQWYYSFVSTACAYGIIDGRGNRIFDPDSDITRQEAAVMVSRAAKLCGMNTVLSDVEVENVLTRFLDCDEVSDWAAVEVAFCRGSGIWDEKDEYIQPLRPALRGEIAQMLYNMLGASRLL